MRQKRDKTSSAHQMLKTLVEFGRALASGVPLREDAILELIFSHASRLMDTDNMYVALYEPDPSQPDYYDPQDPEKNKIFGHVRFPLAYVNGQPEHVKTRRAGGGKTEEIIRTRKPILHVAKAEAIQWYARAGHQGFLGTGLPSWVGVPMVAGNRVVGVIATYHPEREYVYDSDDLQILQAMADQAAVSLEKAALLQRVEKRINQIEAVREVTKAISTILEPQSCMERILDETIVLFDAQYAAISLLENGELVIRVQRGADGNILNPEHYRIKLGTGITGKAAEERCTIRVGDVGQVEYSLPYIVDTRSEMAAPLIEQDNVIGVLNVQSSSEDAFDADDENLFELLAELVVITIQSARKVEAVQKEQARLAEVELDAKMGRLAQAIAHHVRSKTGLVRSDIQDLLDTDQAAAILDGWMRDKLTKARDRTEAIVTLVDDLFKPYRPAELEDVPVSLLLIEAVQEFGEQEGITITLMLCPDPLTIRVETLNTVTYFEEIIFNAVKAIRRAKRPGEIRIETRQADDGFVEVVFSNNGPPIPASEWNTIFEQFEVGHENAQEPGVRGLGLWGARVLFERQGGSIQLQRSDEEGTAFLVRLPAGGHQNCSMIQRTRLP